MSKNSSSDDPNKENPNRKYVAEFAQFMCDVKMKYLMEKNMLSSMKYALSDFAEWSKTHIDAFVSEREKQITYCNDTLRYSNVSVLSWLQAAHG